MHMWSKLHVHTDRSHQVSIIACVYCHLLYRYVHADLELCNICSHVYICMVHVAVHVYIVNSEIRGLSSHSAPQSNQDSTGSLLMYCRGRSIGSSQQVCGMVSTLVIKMQICSSYICIVQYIAHVHL